MKVFCYVGYFPTLKEQKALGERELEKAEIIELKDEDDFISWME